MRFFVPCLVLLVAACASSLPEEPSLPPNYKFGPDNPSTLFITDITSLGDIDRPTKITYVDLDAGLFIDVGREFQGRRSPLATLITDKNDAATFTANVTPPGLIAFTAIAPEPVGGPRPIIARRAPVFELKPGQIGVFSLLTAEVGLEAEGEDPDAMLRAVEAALAGFPNIQGKPVILRPVAFIDSRGEGPGFEDFNVVEDRRSSD